ncbi:MAG: hypothetical protein A3G38_02285 [Omnitrophica WOR_2 bacterium RIFCSPLOWO2_12_FULL_51_8]|nr:MAG: hypothetical protein A3G38_02285 [Omnitrophica WOR_2 bacterium RIFCSPLOWO2_12_FULL_51_8]
MLTQKDRSIIGALAQDIPLVGRPFKALASKLGIEEQMLLERIRDYKREGLLRKYSAALNHRKIGFRHNAMALWNMPEKDITEAGGIMASFREVSHCYARKKAPGWKYNLYSMIHAKSRRECLRVVRAISRRTRCEDVKILFSTKEYKKTAVVY